MGLKIDKSMRVCVIACLALLVTHCKAVDGEQGDEYATVSNCFTQLFPGRIVQNQIQAVIFQNGACIGEYHALNKISYQDKVIVSEDGLGLAGGTAAVLAVDKDIVLVRSAAGVKRIGTIDPNSYAIKTDPGVEFALMVTDPIGGMRQWSLESGGGQEASANEEIVIHIPY